MKAPAIALKDLLIPVLSTLMIFYFWTAGGSAAPMLRLNGATITVEADRVPLRALLHSLADQGVSVQVDANIDALISASFTEQPVERVLASILKPYDYAVVWRKGDDFSPGGVELAELRIFEQGSGPSYRPPGGNGNLAIDRDDGIYFVRNSLLVKLEDGAGEEALVPLLAKIGAVIDETANDLGVVKLRLPDSITPVEAAKVLAGSPGIAEVEPDYAYRLTDTGAAPVAPPSTPVDEAATVPSAALVAVLDSGLDGRYRSERFVASVYDALNQRAEAGDPVGHGTQMSLIAAGVVQPLGAGTGQARYRPIVAVRAFDEHGFTSNHTLMRAVDYALDAGARVISMSWGTEQPSQLLASIIDHAAARGAVLVAAAGNTPSGLPVYPAAYDKVIGVGALNPDGSVWDRSNFGASVSVWAPGVVATGAEVAGRLQVYAGTSVSTAFVASQIADRLNR